MKTLFWFTALLLLAAFMVTSPAHGLRVVKGEVILDALDEYDRCQSKDYSGDWCDDALKRWVKAHPDDAFKAGKMTRRKMIHRAAIPFFADAFERGKGDCKDEDVSLAVVSALDLPPSSDNKILAQAKKIAFENCFNETKDAIGKQASIGSNVFTNSCKALAKGGALTGLKLKKCEEMK